MIYSDIKAKVMDQLKFVFKDESEFDLTILDGILEELPDNINSDRETFANLTETYIKAAKSYKDSDLDHIIWSISYGPYGLKRLNFSMLA